MVNADFLVFLAVYMLPLVLPPVLIITAKVSKNRDTFAVAPGFLTISALCTKTAILICAVPTTSWHFPF
jgi:hypothetical protein